MAHETHLPELATTPRPVPANRLRGRIARLIGAAAIVATLAGCYYPPYGPGYYSGYYASYDYPVGLWGVGWGWGPGWYGGWGWRGGWGWGGACCWRGGFGYGWHGGFGGGWRGGWRR